MWPMSSHEPATWQGCPVCGSVNGLEGLPVKGCVSGRTVIRGVCMRCLDCGETFYALKSGETRLTLRGQPRQAVAATPEQPNVPLAVVEGGKPEQQRYPKGMEGMNMAPVEPER